MLTLFFYWAPVDSHCLLSLFSWTALSFDVLRQITTPSHPSTHSWFSNTPPPPTAISFPQCHFPASHSEGCIDCGFNKGQKYMNKFELIWWSGIEKQVFVSGGSYLQTYFVFFFPQKLYFLVNSVSNINICVMVQPDFCPCVYIYTFQCHVFLVKSHFSSCVEIVNILLLLNVWIFGFCSGLFSKHHSFHPDWLWLADARCSQINMLVLVCPLLDAQSHTLQFRSSLPNFSNLSAS